MWLSLSGCVCMCAQEEVWTRVSVVYLSHHRSDIYMKIIVHWELKVPRDEIFHCFLLIKILCVMFQASLACPSSFVWYVALIATRLILLTLCGWVLCWTLINLFDSYSVLNLLFLGYPWVSRLSCWGIPVNKSPCYYDHGQIRLKAAFCFWLTVVFPFCKVT